MNKTTATILGAALALGVLATQLGKDDEGVEAEVVAAARVDKSLVPIALKLYPDADLEAECCKLPDSDDQCRYGLTYGPGKGGVDSDGVPLTCNCAKADAVPCVGPSADWPEQVERLKREASDAELLELVARKVAGDAKPIDGAPAEAPSKERER